MMEVLHASPHMDWQDYFPLGSPHLINYFQNEDQICPFRKKRTGGKTYT